MRKLVEGLPVGTSLMAIKPIPPVTVMLSSLYSDAAVLPYLSVASVLTFRPLPANSAALSSA